MKALGFRLFLAQATVAVTGALALAPAVQAQEAAPDRFVEAISTDMMAAIKADKKAQSGDLKAVSTLVEKKLMPNVDFGRMTALSVGRPWREASAEQKDKLMAEFKLLLIRTYAGAFSAVKNQTITLLPYRGGAGDDTVVQSQVVQPGAQPIQLDYRMAKSGAQWKIYDVNVLGVWLVQTYRSQFSQEIARGGIDGLIKTLSEKNRAAG